MQRPRGSGQSYRRKEPVKRGQPILANVRNRHRVMAAGAILAAAVVAAGFFAVNARAADEVTETNIGRVDRPIYNNGVPANGVSNGAAYGTKLDTVGDGDNDADKHRAESRNVKVPGGNALRVATQDKLQRFISDADGRRWVTAEVGPIGRSGNAGQTSRSVTPAAKFVCGLHRYRSYSDNWTRFRIGNTFEHEVIISHEWRAYGRAGDCA